MHNKNGKYSRQSHFFRSKNTPYRIEIKGKNISKEGKNMIKPQFETYRYVGEICRVKGQSIVECRLPGSEISSILAVQAKAVPSDATCVDGEIQYGGKMLLCIVYEDGDKKVCRAERGVEFYHKAEGGGVTPACFARAALSCENVTWRREGSGLYVSVVVEADIGVYGSKQMDYLAGGDGLIVKKDVARVYKTVCVSGDTEGEDEFDTDYVGDILLHSEKAVVNRVHAGGGQIDVEGEFALNICVLKGDNGVCAYERLVPFKISLPSEEAFGHVVPSARVEVKSAHLSAGTDEEKGASHIVLSYTLSAECYLTVYDEITVADDGFSTLAEISLSKQKEGGRYLTNHTKATERVSGEAIISPEMEGDFTLQAAVLPRAEIVCRKGERGMEAEGAVLAEVLLCGADGTHRSATLSLPFVFPLDLDGDSVEIDCAVCGLNVRRKRSGETEAEATLRLSLRTFTDRGWEYISGVEEGAPYGDMDSGFSVFMTSAGENLWQVSKRLACAPEDLQKSNPELQFPLKDGERIYVYRQLKD